MNDTYKLIGEKGSELNDVNLTFLNISYLIPGISPTIVMDYDRDENRPMKVEIEVRKFGLWWKL